jgi:ribosomal protein S18 acetylase RimI-like enzyme
MDVSIHHARKEDLEEIYTLFASVDKLHRDALPDVFKEAHDPNPIKAYYLSAITGEDSAIFVAEYGGGIIGAVLSWLKESASIPLLVPRRYVSIDNLAVLGAYRRQGIGKALIAHVHTWAREAGAQKAELSVWEFNQGAIQFYEELGYAIASRRLWVDLS